MSVHVDYTAAEIEDQIGPPLTGVVLTDAQRKVFNHVVTGSPNKEVGEALKIAEKTVKAHVTKILSKYNCDSRARLIAKYYRGELK